MNSIEKAVGFQFRKKKLLKAALTHPSCFTGNQGRQSLPRETFQRLEFLGDAILNSFVARNLYEHFPKANEGLLSRLRSILVSKKLLAKVAQSLRLKNYLLDNGSVELQNNLIHEKVLADVFEAVVAALYFDRGQKAVEEFLSKRFRPYFNEKKLFQLDPNPKSTLQEYTQKKYRSLPVYEAHLVKKNQTFTALVMINNRLKGKGVGRTKQEAEAHAAQALLKKLKIRPVKKKSASRKENSRED